MEPSTRSIGSSLDARGNDVMGCALGYNLSGVRVYTGEPAASARAANALACTVGNSSIGHALEPAARRYLEPRFGHDFSEVRIHTDGAAARSASALAARAYTAGEDIVFNEGEYAPARSSGLHLIAHELAHVVQQRRGGAVPPVAGDPSLEGAANRAADAAIRGTPAAVAGAAGIGIARQPKAAPAPAPAGRVFLAPPAVPINPFEDPKAWSSPAESAQALVAYQKLALNERETRRRRQL